MGKAEREGKKWRTERGTIGTEKKRERRGVQNRNSRNRGNEGKKEMGNEIRPKRKEEEKKKGFKIGGAESQVKIKGRRVEKRKR